MPFAGELAAWPTPLTEQHLKWAEVDTTALAENAAALVRLVAPGAEVMAVVKANGYGHGAVLAARAMLLGGARWLGVSNAEEALQLRRAGVAAPVLVLGWTHPATHATLLDAGVDLTVFDPASLDSMAAAAAGSGRPARVHLKVDTGMHRVGVRAEEAGGLLDRALAVPGRIDLVGLFTHFADADGERADATEEQHARFVPIAERAAALRPGLLIHAANSAATLRFPWTWHNLVRPGLALYGCLPRHCEATAGLRPAMTVAARVTHVATVRAGESVGYNGRWTAERDTRVAVVAAGYADGILRSQSNSGSVRIGGRRCPILGLVSMDQVSVDVSALDAVAPGDEAVILGGDEARGRLSADEVAAAGGTNSYEVLCAVSGRVPRLLV